MRLRDRLGRFWAGDDREAGRDEPDRAVEALAAMIDPQSGIPATTATPNWSALASTATALVRRLDRSLGNPDPRLEKLRDEGFTPDGVAEIEAFAAARGIDDPLEAARRYEVEHPPPSVMQGSGVPADICEPPRLTAVGRDGRMMRINNYAERTKQARDIAAFNMLLGGDDQGFLNYQIPATLREIRNADE
jgi:hypothetical protein